MAERFDLIVFDWDGTLMDSAAAIVRAMQAAARDLDLPPPPDERARYVIGLGLGDALRHAIPELEKTRGRLALVASVSGTLPPNRRRRMTSISASWSPSRVT